MISYGTSSIDPSNNILVGRPFGGVAVLWRNTLAPFVKPISFDDDQIVGLEEHFGDTKVLFLCVYLPYDTKRNFDEDVFYLAKLKSIVEDYESPHVCTLGDFNADVMNGRNLVLSFSPFAAVSSLNWLISQRWLLARSRMPMKVVVVLNPGWTILFVRVRFIFYYVTLEVFIFLLLNASSDHFPFCFWI